MATIKGEYKPTEEDIKNLELFIERFEKSVFYPNKQEEVKDWDKFKEAQEKYCPLRPMAIISSPTDFFQSNAFPFIMKTYKGDMTVNFKILRSEKEFKKFIKNSQYLIHRCMISNHICSKTKNRTFGVYYHKDFGKVGWLKGRLQFVLQKFCNKRFLYWFYDIDRAIIKFPTIQINITNKCRD